MEMTLNQNFAQLSFDEMMQFDGGAWSWGDFWKEVGGGAVTGGIGGATGGVKGALIGAIFGSLGGAIFGSLGGAALYCCFGWY